MKGNIEIKVIQINQWNPKHRPQKQPIRAPKNKKLPKVKSKSKVTIEVSQLHEQTPKKVFEPYQTPKIVHQSHKKSKVNPKVCQNQKSELKKKT